MNLFTRDDTVRSHDADMYRRLRLSALFTLLQEAAIAHTEELGAGRARTLDRGLLWVVTLEEAHIARLPVYGERFRMTSWPGEMMHVFYPRYYQITDEAGETLLTAASLWTLMDAGTRRIVFPEESGVVVPGIRTGEEPPAPKPPKLLETTARLDFTVPYSYADLNGHMNNTRYLDLAEDVMPPELREREIREVAAEFSGEAPVGTDIRLSLGRAGETCTLLGEGEKRLFRLRLEYE